MWLEFNKASVGQDNYNVHAGNAEINTVPFSKGVQGMVSHHRV